MLIRHLIDKAKQRRQRQSGVFCAHECLSDQKRLDAVLPHQFHVRRQEHPAFSYDEPFVSPARYNPQTLVIDGFSKTYGMTGWRLGYAHGPAEIIQQMIKLQQYTFVCAPQPAQWAGIAALDVDMQSHIDAYRRKRDLIVAGLSEDYEVVKPGGAFYVFPKTPWGTGDQFVHKAIEHKLLVIPGQIFSRRDTHFRISYAAPDATIQRGLEVLRKLAHAGR